MKKYIIGITGASGSILTKRLLEFLSRTECELNIVITENGKKVFQYETDISFGDFINSIKGNSAYIVEHDNADLFAPIASGSHPIDCMIILPCSMATAGKIASCTGDSLLCRAADVCLKEKVRLVISPREMPLSAIHLKNLLTLSENGAVIVPPMPMFYAKDETPEQIYDGIVGRILKSAGVENELYKKWRQQNCEI